MKKRENILIIDANKETAEDFRFLLDFHGFNVFVANNEKEALDFLKKGKSISIIFDPLLPYEFLTNPAEVDRDIPYIAAGLVLLNKIKKCNENQHFIFCSVERNKEFFESNGFSPSEKHVYLPKPVRAFAFLEALP